MKTEDGFVLVRTQELIGPPLDWAVAKCEGRDIRPGRWRGKFSSNGGIWQPSTDWQQGGLIIDHQDITVGPWDTSPARAIKGHDHDYAPTYTMVGPTKLIAAMRCYVAFVLGDEVQIPEDLLS